MAAVSGGAGAARWAAITQRARSRAMPLAAVLIGAACGGGLYAGSRAWPRR